ncbi:hypothetical protein V1477_017312 [Vespula maculifrons]|uniref:Uncharacterized protein n=1 Tax=Vespula maculifrons TaxID=7453 RepID=A0ABD2B5P0_VESMC
MTCIRLGITNSFVQYVTTNTEESSAWRSRATYFLDLTTFASNGSRRYRTNRLLGTLKSYRRDRVDKVLNKNPSSGGGGGGGGDRGGGDDGDGGGSSTSTSIAPTAERTLCKHPLVRIRDIFSMIFENVTDDISMSSLFYFDWRRSVQVSSIDFRNRKYGIL